MNISFIGLKRFIIESILEEDKSRMIDKLILPDIEDENEKAEYKEKLKAFFKKYSAFEKFIDWNKTKTLTKADFDEVLAKADNTNSAKKVKQRVATGIDPKSLFKNSGKRKFKIVGENENWLFVAPLTYEAAVFCDSKECGGGSAKWCIGTDNDPSYWQDHIEDEKCKFIMAFNKKFETMPLKQLFNELKYMIQGEIFGSDKGGFNVWNQADKLISNETFLEPIPNATLHEIRSLFRLVNHKEYIVEHPEVDNGWVGYFKPERVENGVYTTPPGGIKLALEDTEDKLLKRIKKIVIRKEVDFVHDFCFSNFENVKVVEFEQRGNDKISIGTGAFSIDKLEEIYFPPNTEFAESPLFDCNNIKKITLPIKYKRKRNLANFLGISKSIDTIDVKFI